MGMAGKDSAGKPGDFPDLLQAVSERQFALLTRLARFTLEGKLADPIVPVPLEDGDYVIYVAQEQSLRVRWISDFDALCHQGYLAFRWNRMSNGRLYSVTQAGIRAAKTQIGWQLPAAVLKRLESVEAEEDSSGRRNPKRQRELMGQMRLAGASLRRHISLIMAGPRVTDTILAVTQVERRLETGEAGLAHINRIVADIGAVLAEVVAAVEDAASGKQAAQALSVFGQWSHTVYELLDWWSA
jgi:hypothetical protein